MWGYFAGSFDFVEFPAYPIMDKSDAEFDELCQKLSAKGLRTLSVTNIFPSSLRILEKSSYRKTDDYIDLLKKRMKRLDVRYLVFGSGPARTRPEWMSKPEADKKIAEIAENLADEFIVLIEPLNPQLCSYITTIEDAMDVIDLCSSDNVGIVADIYNIAYPGCCEDIRRYSEHVWHVHLAEQQRKMPVPPYSEHFSAFLETLRLIKYEGLMSFECELLSDIRKNQDIKGDIVLRVKGEN